MLITQCDIQAGDRVLIWGAAGGLGVFATQICRLAGAHAVGVVSSAEKGELVKQLGAVDYIDRSEFAGMMRKGGETPDEEKERFKVSRDFSKRVKEILGDQPDIVFEHVGKATFPTSVFTVKPFGKVVICAGTTGFDLDFDVRYLWMRQKQIIGSHFANAYEATKANELIDSGADPARPVAHARLRRRARGASADARQPAPRQDLDPGGSRDRARAAPKRATRGRSTRRWAHDRSTDQLADQPVPRRQVRRGLAAGRRGRARLRRHAAGRSRATLDGRLDFLQRRSSPPRQHFERYWYSEEIANKRVELSGYLPGPAAAHLLGGRGRGRSGGA